MLFATPPFEAMTAVWEPVLSGLRGCARISGLFDEEAGISRPTYRNRTTAWMQELAGAVGA